MNSVAIGRREIYHFQKNHSTVMLLAYEYIFWLRPHVMRVQSIVFNEMELFPLRLFHEKWKPLHTYMTTCTCTYMYIEFEVNQLCTSPLTCVPVCNCNTKTQHGFTLGVDTGVRFQPGSIEVCLPRTHVGLWCRCRALATDDFQDLPALCAANLRNKYK